MAVGALFNDPTGTAWFIVAGYLMGAAIAVGAGGAAQGRDARFWYGAALVLLLLGLNKELDLQSILTESARAVTQEMGWYGQRRLFQALFLVALAFGGLAVMGLLATWLRRSSRPVKVAAVGIVLLLTFVLLRAASFHHVDDWVTIDLGMMRSGWWLELAGITVIALSAIAFRRQAAREQSR